MAYDDLGLEPVEAFANEDRPRSKSASVRDLERLSTTTPALDDLDQRLLSLIRALDR